MIDDAVLQETRASRDLFGQVLIGQIDAVVAPLLRLDERSRASIVALVGAAQLVTAYERSLTNPAHPLGVEFDAILAGLHPDGAALLAGLRTAGLVESVAYAWTVALCRGGDGDDDEGQAARAAAADAACAMSHLDGLMDMLRQLRLPEPVASDAPRPRPADVFTFPHDWEPLHRPA
jgi:hypothetical protein